MQKLRATAQQNKVANEAVLRDWIQSRTVREIYEANLARHYLRRKFGIAKSTFDDPRYPARPVNSWAAFVKSRYHGVSEAGDLNQQTKMVKLAQEWKQLSAEERKVGRKPDPRISIHVYAPCLGICQWLLTYSIVSAV
jgi:hypothetical protein